MQAFVFGLHENYASGTFGWGVGKFQEPSTKFQTRDKIKGSKDLNELETGDVSVV